VTTVLGQKTVSTASFNTMPRFELSDPRLLAIRESAINSQKALINESQHILDIKKLETIAGAMERDFEKGNESSRLVAFSHVFREYVRDSKRDLEYKLIKASFPAKVYDNSLNRSDEEE
jgi:hypothetical protein